jgi:hypothetical protein
VPVADQKLKWFSPDGKALRKHRKNEAAWRRAVSFSPDKLSLLSLRGDRFLAMASKYKFREDGNIGLSGKLLWVDATGSIFKEREFGLKITTEHHSKFPAVALPDGGAMVAGIFGGLHHFDEKGELVSERKDGDFPAELFLLSSGKLLSMEETWEEKTLRWHDADGTVVRKFLPGSLYWEKLIPLEDGGLFAANQQDLYWFDASGELLAKQLAPSESRTFHVHGNGLEIFTNSGRRIAFKLFRGNDRD